MVSAVGGALVGGTIDYIGQSGANAANAAEASRNRAFQERMANTAYQRATEDMRRAGLNPALAYQQGGAHAPTGSTAQHQNTLAGAANNASGAARTMSDIQSAAAQREQTEAITEKTKAETLQFKALAIHHLAEAEANAKLRGTDAKLMEETYEPRKEYIYRERQEQEDRLSFNEYHLNTLATAQTEGLLIEELRQQLRGTRAHARGTELDNELKNLDLPRARAEGAAWRTKYGQKIRPWTNDAKAVGSAAAGAAAGFLLRRTPGRPDINANRVRVKDETYYKGGKVTRYDYERNK